MLISLEGVECTGKTTVAIELKQILNRRGLSVSLEPEFVDNMGGPINEALDGSNFISETFQSGPKIALPYMLLHEVTKAEGASSTCDVAVLDRSYDSVSVYQGAYMPAVTSDEDLIGLHLAIEGLLYAAGLAVPELTFLLDVEPDVAAARYLKREGSILPDADRAQMAHLRRLFRCIEGICDRVVLVDGSAPAPAVALVLSELICERLGIEDGIG